MSQSRQSTRGKPRTSPESAIMRPRRDHNADDETPRVSKNSLNLDDASKTFSYKPEYAGEMPKWKVKLTEREVNKWNSLDKDARARCVQAVIRLLLMRGAKNETILRSKVIEALESIDPTFKTHINSALTESQTILNETFGYAFCSGSDLQTIAAVSPSVDVGKDKIFVYNSTKNHQLFQILAEIDSNSAFRGFCVGVFQSIWTSPKKKCTATHILRHLRMMDRRFPETLNITKTKKTNKSACVGSTSTSSKRKRNQGSDDDDDDDDAEERGRRQAAGLNYAIAELGGDFASLIARMTKEGYLSVEVEVGTGGAGGGAGEDESDRYYLLGQRFHAEFGARHVLSSYFQALGMPPDKASLQALTREETRVTERAAAVATSTSG